MEVKEKLFMRVSNIRFVDVEGNTLSFYIDHGGHTLEVEDAELAKVIQEKITKEITY